MVKTFEYNGKNTTVKPLLYFHLVNVCAEEIDF